MPDLQTELSKVINQWSEPEVPPTPEPKQHMFAPTTGTSRAISDLIRTNPGISRKDAVQQMVEKGHNRMTAYSLITQMLRQNLVREAGGALWANYTEYTPLKSYLSWKNAQARKAGGKRTAPTSLKAAKAAAYEAHENYNPTAVATVVAAPEFNAEEFVNGLTLKQAKAVYNELKKVFE